METPSRESRNIIKVDETGAGEQLSALNTSATVLFWLATERDSQQALLGR
jgi:hypothetical protein